MIADSEIVLKIRKTTQKVSENMHIVANDPSMAFYRIQEHVRKVLPPIVEKRTEVIQLQNDLKGRCYDMEYAVGAVKDIEQSGKYFENIYELLKNAIFLKQQLKYEELRKTKKEQQNSVYKRFSAHITLDLPELPDLSGVVRETTNKMEHMISAGKSSTGHGATELQRSHTTLH